MPNWLKGRTRFVDTKWPYQTNDDNYYSNQVKNISETKQFCIKY